MSWLLWGTVMCRLPDPEFPSDVAAVQDADPNKLWYAHPREHQDREPDENRKDFDRTTEWYSRRQLNLYRRHTSCWAWRRSRQEVPLSGVCLGDGQTDYHRKVDSATLCSGVCPMRTTNLATWSRLSKSKSGPSAKVLGLVQDFESDWYKYKPYPTSRYRNLVIFR